MAVKRFDSQNLIYPLEKLDDQIANGGIYMHRGDATTLNPDELDDHQIVQFYSHCTEVIETSLRHLRHPSGTEAETAQDVYVPSNCLYGQIRHSDPVKFRSTREPIRPAGFIKIYSRSPNTMSHRCIRKTKPNFRLRHFPKRISGKPRGYNESSVRFKQ